jgi:vitamin K-dependent gamma-carboxylase
MSGFSSKWLNAAATPVDGASLRLFRFLFGLLMAGALARLQLSGWVGPLFYEPQWTFTYEAFSFIPRIPRALIPWVMAIGFFAALTLAMGRGWLRRIGGLTFFICFAWLKLFDVTNYLNHDYLALLLTLLLTVLPLDGVSLPRFVLWMFRAQVGVVYVFAGLAKINSDWLLMAQPLTAWFAANQGLPLVGPFLTLPGIPLLASWVACFYDTSIVFWLSWRRSRPFAYAAVLVFHSLTAALFDIGIFPVLMTLAATVFFEPDWPRRWLRLPKPAAQGPMPSLSPLTGLMCVVFLTAQVLFPLRVHLLSKDVLWDEQGMRWSWRVMLREKSGSIHYRVKVKGGERQWIVSPLDYLTPRQSMEMSGQPDLIVQLARHIGRQFQETRGLAVEVYVDALVSLNGRQPMPFFRDNVNVLELKSSELPRALHPSPRTSQSHVAVK